ncbi:uncharacterized protein LOC103311980 [Acyrthosiphon pisum]|uniref:Helitron helicase-like domain-containing protein n=1 Tax=Acyrthosiphon pisum TaxID=7029 RepID=A0A8R2FEE4_ACYPI|nr:uncharacterized protein LOC103311980 [Acyrthosiphon pisum]|eukprot:XP_008190127.1 PREDICTED: uncharacterized protein LOC103311980 [Acyrthosiphon pisum]
MREVWARENAPGRDPQLLPRRVSKHFVTDGNVDRRRYNPPPETVNEVAVVFVGDDGQPPTNIDLVIHDRNPIDPQHRRLQTIPAGSSNADPMLYPLLFPRGELGWHQRLLQEGPRRTPVRNRNSIREYTCYRLAIRYIGNNDTIHVTMSLLHNGRFLFQQFVGDHYLRMEANNLQYIRWHQAELFAESYQGLVDHINQQLQLDAPVAGVGRRMILPSSFTGGPRFMKQCYHDAMAIVCKCGKPNLFITFTCNPSWPEISQNLPRWATASDRPDLVSRVFNAKLKQLMRDITVNNIFGNVDAYVYTVEFQKRGLPHAHILIILSEGSKLLTADDVDNVVYAFLPDPVTEPRLFDCVTRHMIHGPCGTLNPNSPCMVDNSCSKKFPKEYSEETVYIADGGYPKYCRPNNGPVARVRNQEVSNEFVVPYNPYLLAKYDAHINVEVCSTVKSVQYLYKYVYKGHDAATMEVWNGNEIDRYVSPPEAVWRLFAYKLHDISHTVVRLPVHLENYHNVYFARGQELQGVQNNALPRTKLTAFFALNERNVDARQYLYHEIPTHYTWQASSKEWRLRQRQAHRETLSRMYVVNPLDRDRFHLRLLLLHRRGPRSFRDLKTVNGVVHATYAAAAVALGLLEDDEAWRACMTESSALDTATQLRYLYVTILLFCHPADLYRRFEVNMMEDFNRRFQNVDHARAACLKAIRDLLRARGKSLDDYGLPSPDEDLLEPDQDDPMFGAIDAAVAWQQRLSELNDEQRTVYDRVMAAVDDNRNVQKMFLRRRARREREKRRYTDA